MTTIESSDTNRVFEVYVSALAQSFQGEPWEEIERYAHRIWIECRMDGDADWATIRERARNAWPYYSAPAAPCSDGEPQARALGVS
jgi:hypothetical protein